MPWKWALCKWGHGRMVRFPSKKVPLQAEEFRKARIQRMTPEMKAEVDVEQRDRM